MTTETLERAAGVIENLERDGYRFLDDLSGYNESTLITYIAAAITQAEDAAHEMDAEWCEHGAQKVWNMMKEEGLSSEKQTILRVCQIFARSIRSFKHAKQEN